MKHSLRVTLVIFAISNVAFLCDPTPEPPSDPEPGPMGEPPGDLPPERPTEPFEGDQFCRPYGVQPQWLRAELPIPLSACSRNLQVLVPHAVWNSRAAARGAPGAFGPGWSLALDQALEVDGDEVRIRRGDYTERHFQRRGDAFVPEPYLEAALLLDDPDAAVEGDETWTFIDVRTGTRFVFTKGDASWRDYRLERTVDRHGFVGRFDRDAAGHLTRVTDEPLEAGGEAPWYTVTWSGDRVSAVRDAAGHEHRYHYDAAGDLVRVDLPADGGSHHLSYSRNVLTERTLPGLESAPLTYSFDGEGRLIQMRHGDERWEVTNDPYLGDTEFELASSSGWVWRARFDRLASGEYVSYRMAEGRRWQIERSAQGYLRSILDVATGRGTRYEPDDGPRPGTTTVIRHPMNRDGEPGAIEEVTWGPYFAPVVVSRSPGPITQIRYEGVGEGCGDAPPAWALGLTCSVQTGDEELRIEHSTEGAGAAERRLTLRSSTVSRLDDSLTVQDSLGRLLEVRRASGAARLLEYDARGFPVRVTRRVDQGGPMPTTYGRVDELTLDAMGEATRSELRALDGSLVSGAVVRRDGAGRVDARETLAASGETVESTAYEDRNSLGVAAREVRSVSVDGASRRGFVFRELDEFGRVTHTESFLPDPEWGVDEHEGQTGYRLIGGRTRHPQ